jgi:LCP family protein required for cell wall assembly
MNKAKRYIIRVVAAVLGLIIGAFLYFVYIFGGTYVPIPIVSEDEYETIALSNDGSLTGGDVSSDWTQGGHTRLYYNPDHPIIKVEQKDPNVENILVFGIDSRGVNDYKCRTDAMIIVSINKKLHTVKLISLMRDTGVYIGDTADTAKTNLDKLNAAYAYGGVGLMINTINRSFGLDIQRFVMLDFGSSADLIDLVIHKGSHMDINLTDSPADLSDNGSYVHRFFVRVDENSEDQAKELFGSSIEVTRSKDVFGEFAFVTDLISEKDFKAKYAQLVKAKGFLREL